MVLGGRARYTQRSRYDETAVRREEAQPRAVEGPPAISWSRVAEE